MLKYWPLGPPVPVPIVNINDTHTHNPSSVLEMFHSPPNDTNLLDGREINHRLS